MLHQISIFIENKPGTLHETLGIIKQENLQIVASSISDTAEYGIYRVITQDPQAAYEALKKHSLTMIMSEVLAISLVNVVGTAADTISLFTQEGLNIEYLYSFMWHQNGILIMRTNDQNKAMEIVRKHQLHCLESADLKF